MEEKILLTETDGRGVATVTLNRPAVHNAFNDALIGELDAAFAKLGADPKVRVIVLRSNGKSFCAGADLNWMKSMVGYSEAENVADSSRLAEMLFRIHACPKPTVARVQGAAMAGGVGLISTCDIAIAAEDAKFGITEVRLGLLPANIALYLVPSIGARAMRRYAMTGETFGAKIAHEVGLVHEVVPAAELDAAVGRVIDALLGAGPHALAECKKLIDDVAGPVTRERRVDTAKRLAAIRVGPEAQARMQAFLAKR